MSRPHTHPHEKRFHHGRAHVLDDPERKTFHPVDEILAHLALTPGLRVADVGAGTGYFAIPLAQRVGPTGHVCAVDVQPEMLEHLAKKLEGHSLPIATVHGEASATTLDRASQDLVLYMNVFHEVDDPAKTLAEARRVLRPGGRVAVLEWRTDVVPEPGPPADHRVSPESVAGALRAAGFEPGETHLVGPFAYMVVAAMK